MSEITWEQLTAGEKNALSRWINIDREFVNEFEKGLQAKGLIRIVRIDHHRHQNMLTDAGRAVLAQAAVGQPEAEGEVWRNDLALYNLTVTLMNNGRIIDAIRTIRTQYRSVGLWDAREYCEAIKAGRSFPTKNAVIERDNRIQDLRAQLAASLEREAALREALKTIAKYGRGGGAKWATEALAATEGGGE